VEVALFKIAAARPSRSEITREDTAENGKNLEGSVLAMATKPRRLESEEEQEVGRIGFYGFTCADTSHVGATCIMRLPCQLKRLVLARMTRCPDNHCMNAVTDDPSAIASASFDLLTAAVEQTTLVKLVLAKPTGC